MDWMVLVRDRGKRRALVNMVKTFRMLLNAVKSLSGWATASFSRSVQLDGVRYQESLIDSHIASVHWNRDATKHSHLLLRSVSLQYFQNDYYLTFRSQDISIPISTALGVFERTASKIKSSAQSLCNAPV